MRDHLICRPLRKFSNDTDTHQRCGSLHNDLDRSLWPTVVVTKINACHEGNVNLEFILRGARAEEKERKPQE